MIGAHANAVVGPRGFEPPTYGSGASTPGPATGWEPPLYLAELRAYPLSWGLS